MYGIDKWESKGSSPASGDWKYPARVKDLTDRHRLARWETAKQPRSSYSEIDDSMDIAVEGLERLIIEQYVDPQTITVTRHAPFSSSALDAEISVDAEIMDSKAQSIRS